MYDKTLIIFQNGQVEKYTIYENIRMIINFSKRMVVFIPIHIHFFSLTLLNYDNIPRLDWAELSSHLFQSLKRPGLSLFPHDKLATFQTCLSFLQLPATGSGSSCPLRCKSSRKYR